jgi:hypothetical protein
VWVLQGCIMFAFLAVPTGVALVFFVPAYWDALQAMSNTRQPPPEQMLELFASYWYFLPLVLILPPIWALLETGLIRTAAKQLRGEPISVMDIFDTGGRYMQVLGYTLMVGLFVTVVNLMCFFCIGIPGFILSGFLFFAHPLIVEGRLGILEAIEVSYRTTRAHWAYYAVWYFLLHMLMNSGTVVCYVGLVATLPLMPLAAVIAYRDVFQTSAHLDPALERTFE